MSLSDKEMKADNFANDNGFFWSEDLKEAIKELIKALDKNEFPYLDIFVKSELKEIFGEDLI